MICIAHAIVPGPALWSAGLASMRALMPLVCGMHGATTVLLGWLTQGRAEMRRDEQTGEHRVEHEVRFKPFRRRLEVVTAPDGHHTVHLRCPVQGCRHKHVQWRAERALTKARRAVEDGMQHLDISDR